MSSNLYSAPWPAPLANRALKATVELPGSKSLTNRELVLSALAKEPTKLTGALVSRDSSLMIAALESLGSRIEDANTTSPTIHPATFDRVAEQRSQRP